MTYILLLFVAAQTSAFVATKPSFADDSYITYIGLPVQAALHFRGDAIFEGDIVIPVEHCEVGGEFHCLDSPKLTLAIPIDGISVGSTWSYQGIEFKAEALATFAPFDHWIDVIVIRSATQRSNIDFYFSDDIGVVAYEMTPHAGASQSNIMLLHGSRGIGSDWFERGDIIEERK